MTPTLKLLVGLVVAVGVALVLSCVAFLALDMKGQGINSRAYERLQVGQTADYLFTLRGTANCVVRIRENKALFFWPTNLESRWRSCPGAVVSMSELPRAYASLQVLLDRDNRIAAVAFEGEASLKTKEPVDGEMLRQLPNSYAR